MANKIGRKIIAVTMAGSLSISFIQTQSAYAIDTKEVNIDSNNEEQGEASIEVNEGEDIEVDEEKVKDEQQEVNEEVDKVIIEDKDVNESTEKEPEVESHNTELIINSIEVDKNEVEYPGGSVKVSMDIQNRDNINSVWVSYTCSSMMTSTQTELRYNQSTGKFEGTINGFYLNEYDTYANYTIDRIDITDKNNNTKYIHRMDLQMNHGIDPSTLDFKVKKWAPVINSVEISNKIVYSDFNESTKISLDIDNSNDIQSVSLDYGYRHGGTHNLYKNQETGKFEGEITTNSSYPTGTMSIEKLNIQRSNGQYISINGYELDRYNVSREDFNIKIEVYSPKSISAPQDKLVPGDRANIALDMSNYPRDIKSIRLNYKNPASEPDNTSTKSIEMKYNDSSKLYEGVFDINRLSNPGTWEVYSIEVVSKNDEYHTIYNNHYEGNLSNGNINIENNIRNMIYPINVEVSNKDLSVGEEVKISASGIDKSIRNVSVTYQNLKTDWEYPVNLIYNSKTKQHEGYMKIDPYMNEGMWVINAMYLSDEYDQITIYNEIFKENQSGEYLYKKDFKMADINVSGTIKDTKAPEFKGISVDKKVAKPGDKVTISMDIVDDQSGIDWMEIQLGGKNSNQVAIPKPVYNEKTKKYEITIDIDGTMPNGLYSISEIYACDKAGNNANFNTYSENPTDLSGADFEVVESIVGYENIIKSVTIDEKQPQAGDTINISVELTNNANIGTVEIPYNHIDGYEYVKLKYNEETNKYEGRLTIHKNAKNGIWRPEYINFSSNSGEWITSVPVDSYGLRNLFEFEVISKIGTDMIIDNIGIDKDRVTKGESVTLNVSASDKDGDIRKVFVIYNSPDGSEKSIQLDNIEGIFTTNIDIEEYTSPGTWKVNNIVLEDNDRNRMVVYNTSLDSSKEGMDLNSCDFEVYGTKLDKTKPELISVSVDKIKAIVGDKITVSISAKDIGSGIKSIKANFANPMIYDGEKPHPMLDFTYNEKTDTYDCIIDTASTYETIHGTSWIDSYEGWMLNEIKIDDNAGNVYHEWIQTSEVVKNESFIVTTGSWYIKEVTDKDTFVEGVTEANSNVTITIGNRIYKGKSDKYGKFKIEIPKQGGQTKINVVVTNIVGTELKNTTITVKDYTAPEEPIVNNIVTDKTTVLEGKAEPNSTVVIMKEVKSFGGTISVEEIAKGKSDSNGSFSIDIKPQEGGTRLGVKSIDNSGNESSVYELTVKDTTAPNVPVVKTDITSNTTVIEGTSEYGSEILVLSNNKVIARDFVFKDGTFKVNIEPQKGGTELSIVSRDGYGNTSEAKVVVVKGASKPKIILDKNTFNVGEEFDPMSIVKAIDDEDGDLTHYVIVTQNNVNTSKSGKYKVSYAVLDSDGNRTDETFVITVVGENGEVNDKPVINAKDVTLSVGEQFNVLEGVTAIDNEDGDLTHYVIVAHNTVDTSKPGKYKVTYAVLDSDGNRTDKTISVSVLGEGGSVEETNELPVIDAKDITIGIGSSFDVLEGIVATDKEDGDLTRYILVTENSVDTSKAGKYKVSYAILDTDGNRVDVSINVTVE